MPKWICIFRPNSTRERWVWAYRIFPREALRVCSFNYDGQCEGLNKRERANSTALTLFLYKPINRQRGEPSGTIKPPMLEQNEKKVAAENFANLIRLLAEEGRIGSLSITIDSWNSDKLFQLAQAIGIKELSVTAQFGA